MHHRPVGRSDVHGQEAPLIPGPQFLTMLAARMLSRLHTCQRRAIVTHLASWIAVWSLGTMCSGTDVAVLCQSAIAQALLQELGVRIAVEHSFSVEKCGSKRRFLKTMFPALHHLFADALDMCEASVWNCCSRTRSQVPVCSWLVAGFPCTDVSNLNQSRSHHRSIVNQGGKSTGGVFQAIINFLFVHLSVNCVILENVLGLAYGSNLKACIDALQACGFFVIVWHLDPGDFGTPQRRARLWLLCIRKSWLAICGIVNLDRLRSTLLSLMNQLVDHAPVPLDKFLLKESDSRLRPLLSPKVESRAKRAKTEVLGCWIRAYQICLSRFSPQFTIVPCFMSKNVHWSEFPTLA